MDKFLVINNKEIIQSPDHFLLEKKYYKSYALFLAHKNNIRVSDTLILTSVDSIDVVETYLDGFNEPIMLRMDYECLSNRKYVGGIPIYSLNALKKTCLFLFKNNFIPILQPYADRYKNTYNANCSLTNNADVVYIELLGNGFDAGDLRLGLINSHEEIQYDFTEWKLLSRRIITSDEYLISKSKRETYITKMEKYIEYVNKKNKLLDDISNMRGEKDNHKLNDEYIPISKEFIMETAYLSYIIKNKIIPSLPYSQDYIASISIMENGNHVLWDVYGRWYFR